MSPWQWPERCPENSRRGPPRRSSGEGSAPEGRSGRAREAGSWACPGYPRWRGRVWRRRPSERRGGTSAATSPSAAEAWAAPLRGLYRSTAAWRGVSRRQPLSWTPPPFQDRFFADDWDQELSVRNGFWVLQVERRFLWLYRWKTNSVDFSWRRRLRTIWTARCPITTRHVSSQAGKTRNSLSVHSRLTVRLTVRWWSWNFMVKVKTMDNKLITITIYIIKCKLKIATHIHHAVPTHSSWEK